MPCFAAAGARETASLSDLVAAAGEAPLAAPDAPLVGSLLGAEVGVLLDAADAVGLEAAD